MDLRIVICGVGGQGVLYFARNLYALAVIDGRPVMGSETHGMSQRGGSVVSHVKIGNYFSPMVQRGTADVLFALAPDEAYSNLGFLRRRGRLLINCRAEFQLHDEVRCALGARGVAIERCDAGRRAVEIGAPRAANLIVLAFAIGRGTLPFSVDQLKKAAATVAPPSHLAAAMAAIDAGVALAPVSRFPCASRQNG